MKRLFFSLAAAAATLLLAPKAAHAFGGEDPINGNPWHHQMITEDASKSDEMGDMKWTPEAASSIAWHADYVDSYLYNPLWWAASVPDSGIKRFKASRSVQTELEALHFDDLFSTDKVNAAWRRYASGTFAGLMWAKEHDDVPAAQNILGASLHAIQDFYSHSNWIDNPARRNITYFNIDKATRANTAFFTGAYEHDLHNGVKSHGKYLYAAALFKRPGIEQVMEAACSAFSPMSGSDICEDYKLSKGGVSVRPTIDTKLFGGVKVPNDVLVLAPPGIALDNTWIAAVGVKQRGLTDLDGVQGFNTARALAVKQSMQWLQTMEKAMVKAGAGEFWKQVRTQGSDDKTRFAQYEQFNKFPFLFLAAGPYPPVSAAEEWYLRIKLTTGTEQGSGTDADIKLRVAGQPDKVLDWMPKANPILAHNDFENGDDEIYIAGPYSQPPSEIELYNDSANAGEVVGAAARAVKDAVVKAVGIIPGIVKGILGTSADHIATNHRVWMPEELAQVPTAAQAPGKTVKILGRTITLPPGQEFSLDFNGGGEGVYRAKGLILKSDETADTYSFQIRLTGLECIKESDWDRGSNSDEPFLVGAVNPLPGESVPFLSDVFDDVDKGETVGMNTLFRPVTVPKNSGMLNVALGLFEHDDESQKSREELRDKFVGKIDEEAEDEKRGLLDAIGAATASKWKLQHIEVEAWSRNGRIKVGNMLSDEPNRWIKGKEGAKFTLSMANVKDTGITTDELLPYLPPNGQPSTGNTGNTPDTGTTTPGGDTTTGNPLPDAGGDPADLDKWLGKWMTDKGELTFKRDGSVLKGQVRRENPIYKVMANAETMELRAVGDGLSVEGTWKFSSAGGTIKLTLAEPNEDDEHPEYERFNGTYTIDGQTAEQKKYLGETSPWNGWRLRKTGNTGSTGNNGSNNPTPNNTGSVPPLSNPGNGNPGTVPPLTGSNNGNPGTVPPLGNTPGGGTSGGGAFQSLTNVDFRIDEARVGRDGTTLELISSMKNKANGEIGITAGNYGLVITDADGIGFSYRGNLYRASGDTPEPISETVRVRPEGLARIRFVFDVPAGVSDLKSMTIRENGASPRKFDLSNVKWPNAEPAFSGAGLKNGSSEFKPFGETYDVRLDGTKKARDGATEVFLTFKNMLKDKQVGFTTSVYKARLEDADGIAVSDMGNLYRANGDPAERIQHTVRIEGGVETHIRVRFQVKGDFKPQKFTLTEPYGKTTLEWPLAQ